MLTNTALDADCAIVHSWQCLLLCLVIVCIASPVWSSSVYNMTDQSTGTVRSGGSGNDGKTHTLHVLPFCVQCSTCGSALGSSAERDLKKHLSNTTLANHYLFGGQLYKVKDLGNLSTSLGAEVDLLARQEFALVADPAGRANFFEDFLDSEKAGHKCVGCGKLAVFRCDFGRSSKRCAHISSNIKQIRVRELKYPSSNRVHSRKFIEVGAEGNGLGRQRESCLSREYLDAFRRYERKAQQQQRIDELASHAPIVHTATSADDEVMLGGGNAAPISHVDVSVLLKVPLAKFDVPPAVKAIKEVKYPTDPDNTKLSMYQLQGLASGDTNHLQQLEFSNEIGYVGLATAKFGGNFEAMSEFLSVRMQRPDHPWEINLRLAALTSYDDCINLLPTINSQAKGEIMKIGTYKSHSATQRLISLIRGRMEMVSEYQNEEEETEYIADVGAYSDLFDEIHDIVGASDSAFAPSKAQKHLKRLAPTTDKRYRPTCARLALFIARHLLSIKDPWFVSECMPLLCQEPEGPIKDQHKAVVMKLFLTAIDLHGGGGYASLVKEEFSMLHCFLLACGLDKESLGTNSLRAGEFIGPMIRTHAPYKIHQACSQLLYNLRIHYLGGMLLACDERHAALRNLLKDVTTFCRSRNVMTIASCAAIAKKFEKCMDTGNGATTVDDSHEDGDICFITPHPSFAGNVIVTKSDLEVCGRLMIGRVRDALEDIVRDILPDSSLLEKLNLRNPQTLSRFIAVLFDGGKSIKKAGEYNAYQHNLTGDRPDGSKAAVLIYASTVSVTFIEHRSGDCEESPLEFSSSDLATCMSEVLEKGLGQPKSSPEWRRLKRFDDRCQIVLVAISALMTHVLRGSPRDCEIFRHNCGVTNCLFVNEAYCDVIPFGMGNHHDRIQLHFGSMKWSGSADLRDAPLLSFPEVLGGLYSVYLSLCRVSQVKTLVKASRKGLFDNRLREDQLRVNFCWATTRFAWDIQLSASPVSSSLYFGLLPECGRMREQDLGLSEGMMTSPMWRMVKSSVSNLIYAGRVTDHKVPRSAALGSNHEPTTQSSAYSEQAHVGDLPSGKVPLSALKMGMLQDAKTHQWLGVGGSNMTNPLQPSFTPRIDLMANWRKMRLPTDREAYGLVKLVQSANFDMVSPIQRYLTTEVISGVRDSLMRLPCGMGKTLANVARVGYAYGCAVVRGCGSVDDALVRVRLTERLERVISLQDSDAGPGYKDLGKSTSARAEELCDTLLSDADVRAILEFALSDPNPPPTSAIGLVIIPNDVSVTSTVSDINKYQLIRAMPWKGGHSHDHIVASLNKRSTDPAVMFCHNGGDFDILVMTGSRATMPSVSSAIEHYCRKGVVGEILLDEVHTMLTELFRSTYGRIGRMPRFDVPVVGLTGTLAIGCIKPLGNRLSSNLGRPESVSHQPKSKALSTSTDSLDQHYREFVLSNGIRTLPCTIPTQVRHSVIRTIESGPSLYQTIARFAVARVITNDESKCCHIFVPTRSDVDVASDAIRSEAARCGQSDQTVAATLLGGADEEDKSTFMRIWINGDLALFAVTTTVGAMQLNNKRCDLVIAVDMVTDIHTYIQLTSRAGRGGQPSEAIFVLSKSAVATRKALEERVEEEYRMMPLAVSGVDVAEPELRKALSIMSLVPALSDEVECRRRYLATAMDGITSTMATLNGDSSFCCDKCNPVWSESVQHSFDVARTRESPIVDEELEFQLMTSLQAASSQEGTTVSQEEENGGVPHSQGYLQDVEGTVLSDQDDPLVFDDREALGLQTPSPHCLTASQGSTSASSPSLICLPTTTTPPQVAAMTAPPHVAMTAMPPQLAATTTSQVAQVAMTATPQVATRASNEEENTEGSRRLAHGALLAAPSTVTTERCTQKQGQPVVSQRPANPYLKANPPTGKGPLRPSRQVLGRSQNASADASGEQIALVLASISGGPNIVTATTETSSPAAAAAATAPRTGRKRFFHGSSLSATRAQKIPRPLPPSSGLDYIRELEQSTSAFFASIRESRRCCWHGNINGLHPNQDSLVNCLANKQCRAQFSKFIGFQKASGNRKLVLNNGKTVVEESGIPCMKCGDHLFGLCGKNCPLGRIQECAGVSRSSDYCWTCGVYSGGSTHHECGGASVWGLAIGGLRSRKGYFLVKRAYDKIRQERRVAENLPQYPSCTPFSFDDLSSTGDSRKTQWTAALNFLVSDVNVNLAFWESVRRAERYDR